MQPQNMNKCWFIRVDLGIKKLFSWVGVGGLVFVKIKDLLKQINSMMKTATNESKQVIS